MRHPPLAMIVILSASIACSNEHRPLPPSHEWGEKPEAEFKAGHCDRALQALHDVPVAKRDSLWWQMFQSMSTMCLFRDKNESYRAALLKEFAEAEPSRIDDPSFLYWYGVALDTLDQRSAAAAKYLAAERAAQQVLAMPKDEDARYHAQVVLENITRNRQGPAPKPTTNGP